VVAYRGPYDDAPFTAAHDNMGDPFVGGDDSRLCGQCHQVDNPLEHLYDAAGKDTGKPFPLDTTYEEWQQSSFSSGATARSCQSCHMPAEAGAHAIASSAGYRDDPPRHDFVGGNDWGPALLKAAFPGLRDAQYDYTRAAAQANLKQAARLEIRTPVVEGTSGDNVDLGVRVTNLGGHKFPTGYADGRRAWVEVAVIDASKAVDVQSGAYDFASTRPCTDATAAPRITSSCTARFCATAASRRPASSPRPPRNRWGQSRFQTAKAGQSPTTTRPSTSRYRERPGPT
jgi:hypothetical protein